MFCFIFQQKIKNLRQSYDRARDKVSRSGASVEIASKLCPFFEKIDLFLRDKPLTRPHFMASSSEDVEGDIEDPDDIPDPLPVAIALPDLPTESQGRPDTHTDSENTGSGQLDHEQASGAGSLTTPPRIPGKNLRKKKGNNTRDLDTEQLLLEHREFAAKSGKLLEQHFELEKKKYEEQRAMLLEDRAMMKEWMQQQKEENKGMLNIMGEMVGILKGLQPCKNVHQAPTPTPVNTYPSASHWGYSGMENQVGQGYAGDYRSYQPDEERPLDFHQL